MSELIKTKVSKKVDTVKYNVVEIGGVEYFRQDWMVFKMVEYAKAKLEQSNGVNASDSDLHLQHVMASAFDCLKNIANPINYMQEQAEKDGCKLNGQMAVSLSEDANYLKGLANNFLARHLL